MNRTLRGVVSAVMCLLLVGSTAGSSAMASDQQKTIGPAELDAALALHERKEAAQRDRVRAVLQRDDVRAMAAADDAESRCRAASSGMPGASRPACRHRR